MNYHLIIRSFCITVSWTPGWHRQRWYHRWSWWHWWSWWDRWSGWHRSVGRRFRGTVGRFHYLFLTSVCIILIIRRILIIRSNAACSSVLWNSLKIIFKTTWWPFVRISDLTTYSTRAPTISHLGTPLGRTMFLHLAASTISKQPLLSYAFLYRPNILNITSSAYYYILC